MSLVWGNEMAIALCRYVSAYVSPEKIRVTVWVTFCVFYSTCLAPLQSKWYMCIYIGVQGQMLMHVSMLLCSVFLFFVWCESSFLPRLCFSSQSSVPLTFSSFHCSLSLFTPHSCRNCNHVRGSGEGKKGSMVGGKGRGERESLKWTWGRGRKRHLYVYPITTPACPKSPSQRTDTRALKIATSIPPPPYSGDEVDWIISWPSSRPSAHGLLCVCCSFV